MDKLNDFFGLLGSFIMESVEFSTCLGNFRNPLRRVRNHHVAIHKDVGDILVNVFEDGGTHRDVGHKMAIHDVHVEPVTSIGHHSSTLIAEVGQVARKHRGGDDSFAHFLLLHG